MKAGFEAEAVNLGCWKVLGNPGHRDWNPGTSVPHSWLKYVLGIFFKLHK